MEEIETEEAPKSSSLFPVFPQSQICTPLNPSTSHDAVPEWLRNSSFTTDISVINNTVSTNYSNIQFPQNLEDKEGEDIEKENKKGEGARYELLDSSASERGHSSTSDDEERKSKKKKKRRKKRQRLSNEGPNYDYALSSSRKRDVRTWASSSATDNVKDYYFDSRGDRDNLAFGTLYRMDVARYKLHNSRKNSELNYYRWNDKRSFERESDIDALDNKLRSGGRYWSATYAAIEHHKNLKRLRFLSPLKPMMSMPADFISLPDEVKSDEGIRGDTVSGNAVVEESWEDEVFRKTKEFNKMTRERPHDAQIWLAFAQFQDKVARMQPQKGARLQTLEKKISILEKATELNPDSEDLLLSLMNAYQSRDSIDDLISRWEKILLQNSGSYTLWREFLRVVQGDFSRFKVTEMRKMYANAIQALSGAWSKQHRQVSGGANSPSMDPAIVRLEHGLVDIFLSLCRFEWQAGYRELATAMFQAQIEYSLFCPSLLLSEQSKQRLFEHFWNSNGARVGEDGALGWSKWLEKEEELRQTMREEPSHDSEKGGWTGWSDPLSKSKENNDAIENITETDSALDELEDGSEMKDDEQTDDTEALLKMLGIDAAAEANGEIKDTRTWTRWSEEEVARDSSEWMPVHAKTGSSHSEDPADAPDDEQLLRVIAYEDVSDYLFSISSEEGRFSLVSQFIDFYGGRMAQWTCTNSSSWAEKSLSLEAMPDSLFDELRRVHYVLTKKGRNQIDTSLEQVFSSSDDISMRTSMMEFVRNATLLCCTVFPQNHILEEAVLIAEELSNTMMNTSSCSVTPCRTLAKSLLKSNRQDVLLCGVYARREAVFGNIDHARKIFDMALSSIDGLPQDFQTSASLLYLWYAEVELENGSRGGSVSAESSLRAMHILSCLGSGMKYSPYKCKPSSLQQLKAHQGFKEQVNMLCSSWTRGLIDDQSVALICSAALFEEITIGWTEGVQNLEQAFTMVLPERRRNSYHLERLFNFYMTMLCRHHQEMKLSKFWEYIVKGLDIYPCSPNVYNALVEIGHLYVSPNKLRWIFDENFQKKPSLVAWLFALSFDMSKGGTEHRIRRLFERALENVKLRNSVLIWRSYIAYESDIACNPSAARRAFFRAIHACPWSKRLWLDGFIKLASVLTAKELSDLQEVMRDKELNLRTDIYEILLQDDDES
uniref:Protein NRDE2 homolog isoform X2 n=1 Tax=Nicotiana tabacum TaxID=4097 RepID=A0A1S3ZC69_TOBAC|nr:PREDICTED: protein NRDE2 homolog isoform X2 [Nicotiana tabacum]